MSGCCVSGAFGPWTCSFGLSLNRDQYAKLNTPTPADACTGLQGINVPFLLIEALKVGSWFEANL